MSEYDDNSSIYVSQWLLHWKVPFIRIDKEDKFTIAEIILENNSVDYIITSSDKKTIKISEIKAVWYRRGDLNLIIPDISFIKNRQLYNEIYQHLLMENKVLEHYFYHLMNKKPHIGSYDKRSVNKLIVLHEAQNIGIRIPSTFVLTEKEKVNNILSEELITKGIFEGFKVEIGSTGYITYTEKIDKSSVPDEFFPTLFQNAIDKEADIRSFYIYGSFYSMAIKSQSNKQTTIDFRKYIVGQGNRSFPFQLPSEIEVKLDKLMKKIGLNTGSIDLIFTKDGNFIFLEVNPVGQFGMTSIPCNYFLEKKIACLLTKISTEGYEFEK